ncbi:unnamed protein product, partial [Pleuronectes platessa]
PYVGSQISTPGAHAAVNMSQGPGYLEQTVSPQQRRIGADTSTDGWLAALPPAVPLMEGLIFKGPAPRKLSLWPRAVMGTGSERDGTGIEHLPQSRSRPH